MNNKQLFKIKYDDHKHPDLTVVICEILSETEDSFYVKTHRAEFTIPKEDIRRKEEWRGDGL